MITCPGNQTINSDPGQSFATVSWTKPEATDNSGQHPAINCSVDSGSQFGIGKTDVVCKAWDMDENHVNCSFTVRVRGKLTVSSTAVYEQ